VSAEHGEGTRRSPLRYTPGMRLEPPDPVVFATRLRVRVTDLNYGRHLGHMELVGLLHEARVEYLRTLGHREDDVDGRCLMVVELGVSYRAEALAGQVLVIELGMALEGSRGLEIRYGVREGTSGVVVAVARTVVVFADPGSKRVTRVPEPLRKLASGADVDVG
jgi:acyl-CoA thioester hydrolase